MIIKDIKITIDFNQVLKELGFKQVSSVLTPPMEKMVREEIERAQGLINPQAIVINFSLTSVTEKEIITDCDSLYFKTRYLAKNLSGCTKASLFICTLGSKLEERVKDYFAEGEQTRAYIMNGIGSAAAEEVAEYVNQIIIKEAEGEGFKTVRRFSPGYGDWNLSDQQAILKTLNPSPIGVTLTERCIMIPEKSITAIVGWKKI
ncbi:MAG: vitamin B12 dependent-methionine synthase activation domain-containing protein [Nitrospinota bacterium]